MERILYSAREKQAAYQLINIKGIGKQSAIKLIEYAGSASEAMQLQEQEVRQCLSTPVAERFIRGRESQHGLSVERLEKEKECRFVPFTSPEYPEKLRNITDPPFALYVRGELPQENLPSVAIVGARACSEYGKSVAGYFGKRLGTMGVQIISGMAKGIDGIAQQGALDGGGTTYAVLGSGVDVIYPPENAGLYQSIRTKGGIISEYPPGTEAQSALFPQRNRIISGLSDILLVVEARKRSGTYITVTQALEQGKEVYVVPGRITDALSEGCNFLLSQGAGVAAGPESIAEELERMGRFYNPVGMAISKDTLCADRRKDGTGETKTYEVYKTGVTCNTSPSTDKHAKADNLLNDHILSCLDITPIALDELYHRLRDKIPLSMEQLLLELTKMQMTGRVEATGTYYRIPSHL